jgi:hypothetical protein
MDLNLKKIYLDGLINNHNKSLNNIIDEIKINNHLNTDDIENIKNEMNEHFKKIINKILFLIVLNSDY